MPNGAQTTPTCSRTLRANLLNDDGTIDETALDDEATYSMPDALDFGTAEYDDEMMDRRHAILALLGIREY